MADQLRLRGGDKTASDNFTGAEREVTVDTSEPNLRVHDGKTPGGHKVLMAGNCLVVDKDPCKVTVNGDFEVVGDTNLDGDVQVDGNMHLDGNLLVDGDLIVIDDTIGLDTSHVWLTNPKVYSTYDFGDPGSHIPDPLYPLITQEDLNQYFGRIFNALDGHLIEDDVELARLNDKLNTEIVSRLQEDKRQERVDDGLQAQLNNIDVELQQNEAAHLSLQKAILDGDALINERIDELCLSDLYDVEALTAKEGDVIIKKGSGWAPAALIDIVPPGEGVDKLDDVKDVNVPAPQNGQILTRRGAFWVAENNPFVEQGIRFKGFVNTAVDSAPSAEAGDTYIQHDAADEKSVTAGPSWGGIAGQMIQEGQYVMFGADNEWHKGKTIDNVAEVQSDWNETAYDSPKYIANKPDIYTKAEVDDKIDNLPDPVQASWLVTNTTDPAYIVGKPDVYTKAEVNSDFYTKAEADSKYLPMNITSLPELT